MLPFWRNKGITSTTKTTKTTTKTTTIKHSTPAAAAVRY